MLVGAVVVGAGAGAWWFFGGGDRDNAAPAEAGQLAVSWRGRYRGEVTLPAKLNWCPVTRTGVLTAISADTGVAVVLYEVDSLSKGPHAAVLPSVTPVLPRPGASMAMRWPRDSATLVAFASQSGLVEIRAAGKLVSGTLRGVKLRAATGADTLTVDGSFTDVPVTAMALGCP